MVRWKWNLQVPCLSVPNNFQPSSAPKMSLGHAHKNTNTQSPSFKPQAHLYSIPPLLPASFYPHVLNYSAFIIKLIFIKFQNGLLKAICVHLLLTPYKLPNYAHQFHFWWCSYTKLLYNKKHFFNWSLLAN